MYRRLIIDMSSMYNWFITKWSTPHHWFIIQLPVLYERFMGDLVFLYPWLIIDASLVCHSFMIRLSLQYQRIILELLLNHHRFIIELRSSLHLIHCLSIIDVSFNYRCIILDITDLYMKRTEKHCKALKTAMGPNRDGGSSNVKACFRVCNAIQRSRAASTGLSHFRLSSYKVISISKNNDARRMTTLKPGKGTSELSEPETGWGEQLDEPGRSVF